MRWRQTVLWSRTSKQLFAAYRCFRQTLLCSVSVPLLCLSIFFHSSVFSSPALPQYDWQMSVPLSKYLDSDSGHFVLQSTDAAAAVALPSPFRWSIGRGVIILCNRQCRCFSCSICRSLDIDGADGRYWLQTWSSQEITVQLTFHGIQFIVSPSGSIVASNDNICGFHSARCQWVQVSGELQRAAVSGCNCQESCSVQLSVSSSVRRAAACSCQWVQVPGELQRAAVSGCKCQESCSVQLSMTAAACRGGRAFAAASKQQNWVTQTFLPLDMTGPVRGRGKTEYRHSILTGHNQDGSLQTATCSGVLKTSVCRHLLYRPVYTVPASLPGFSFYSASVSETF